MPTCRHVAWSMTMQLIVIGTPKLQNSHHYHMAKITILPSTNFFPKTWSGGTTTELFIYPSAAKYAERNFDFRLSTATVEVEKSIFTPLIGVSRTLMVLDGGMSLDHEDHHNAKLGKMGVDQFEGDWNTSSVGKCTDFNLMTTSKTSGLLEGIALEKDQVTNHTISKGSDWFFVYSYSGKANIDIDGDKHTISKGDLLIINGLTSETIQIHSIDSSELVLCHTTH